MARGVETPKTETPMKPKKETKEEKHIRLVSELRGMDDEEQNKLLGLAFTETEDFPEA